MRKRRLGRTGLEVSEIGFGCWPISGGSYGPVRDEDSLEALETAWDSGVNFFDTADIYGEGHSETLVGRFLKARSRDGMILATKAGWNFYPSFPQKFSALTDPPAKINHAGHGKNFEPEYIRFACEQSLKRLGVGAVDLYQLHNPPLELIQKGDAVDVLEGLKKEGKIRFIGISVHTVAEALAVLTDVRVHAIQVIFNILDQRMAGRFFPEAAAREVGVIVREPLASGLLSGKYGPSYEFPKNDHRRRWVREKREVDWQKIRLVQKTLGPGAPTLAKAALEFALAFETIATVIPGAKTRAQTLENISASLRPALSREDIERMKGIYAREKIFQRELNPR
jgi:aryl-alcohol dehydrogenase-like predicted oxidoreductase